MPPIPPMPPDFFVMKFISSMNAPTISTVGKI